MLDMEHLIKRYDELYQKMAMSKDPSKMVIFGEAEKWVFHSIVEKHPELAETWIGKLEASEWYNYLSKQEAEGITGKLINQDGTRGAHWNYETFKAAVENLGGNISDEPYYNCYALWAVANMRFSDHYMSAKEFVPKEQMPKYFYMMAVETLKDVDHPNFVRSYFHV